MIKVVGRELSFENDSWIKKVKYNLDTKLMLVNGQYECQEVPANIFLEFAMAQSKGKYWNKEIKGKFLHPYFE